MIQILSFVWHQSTLIFVALAVFKHIQAQAQFKHSQIVLFITVDDKAYTTNSILVWSKLHYRLLSLYKQV